MLRAARRFARSSSKRLEPLRWNCAVEHRSRRAREIREPTHMAVTYSSSSSSPDLGELLRSELPDRLEHEVARLVAIDVTTLTNEALAKTTERRPRDRPHKRPRSPEATLHRRTLRSRRKSGAHAPRAGRSSTRWPREACAAALRRTRGPARTSSRVASRSSKRRRWQYGVHAPPRARRRAGRLSRRAQSSMTTRESALSSRRAPAARARAKKRSKASSADKRLNSEDVLTRNGQRLAARRITKTSGHEPTNLPTRLRHRSMTCSQLSTSRSNACAERVRDRVRDRHGRTPPRRRAHPPWPIRRVRPPGVERAAPTRFRPDTASDNSAAS